MVVPRHFLGFTLIELLVAIAILSLLVTFSLTTYKDFQANQQLHQVQETLKTNLRFAQSQALGGVRDCGASMEGLTGWFISFSNTSYTVNVRCGTTVGSNPRTFDLSSGITLATNIGSSSILFQPINKEVALLNGASVNPLSADVMITLTKGTKTQTVTVRKTGDIQ